MRFRSSGTFFHCHPLHLQLLNTSNNFYFVPYFWRHSHAWVKTFFISLTVISWACVPVLIYPRINARERQNPVKAKARVKCAFAACVCVCLCMCVHAKPRNRMPAESRIAGLSVRQVLESLLGSDKCIYGKSQPAFISSLQVRSPIKKKGARWREREEGVR